jgi:hypothetical protein
MDADQWIGPVDDLGSPADFDRTWLPGGQDIIDQDRDPAVTHDIAILLRLF